MNKIIDGVGRILHKGFATVREIVVMIKGIERTYEQIESKGAVAGIVISEDGKIGLVHQFRATADKVVIEIPAGTLDKEDVHPMEILFDELEEEIGIGRDTDILSMDPAPILDYYMMVGCCTAKMLIYLMIVKPQQQDILDISDGDVIRTEWVDIDTFGRYIAEGKIVDGKTIMAYWYLRAKPHLLAT
jgi:ADP-ribose pyrophosphatase